MSARVLIVDDLVPNLNLLEVKLAAEYYDVVRATSGSEALKIADREHIDLVLLDALMPGMNGFETCERLKTNPKTWHVPVAMVTALEETKDRIRGLEAGADDFITKPIDDFNFSARVRSLLRLKMVTDQLLSNTQQSVEDSRPIMNKIAERRGRVMVLEDAVSTSERVERHLGQRHDVSVVDDPRQVMERINDIDLLIVSLTSDNFDGLRLCARLQSDPNTRDLPILAITDGSDETTLIRAYDIGVNDTLMRPIESQELAARVNSQLRRKFYTDSLRDDFQENLAMVVSDPLTGLGNRRYFDRNIQPLFEEVDQGKPFSLIVFDVDHFKRVNDILGHDIGDVVLKEVAARLVTNMRAIDIVSRYGGEEFLIAMPDTALDDAYTAADRIRGLISGTPVFVDSENLWVTLSAGIAEAKPGEKLREIFKRADDQLYAAKHAGRNQVKPAPETKAAA